MQKGGDGGGMEAWKGDGRLRRGGGCGSEKVQVVWAGTSRKGRRVSTADGGCGAEKR